MWWILLLLVGILMLIAGLTMLSWQKKLVRLDEACKQALTELGDRQNALWNVLIARVRLIQEYSLEEYNHLVLLICERHKISAQSNAPVVKEQEGRLSELNRRLQRVVRDYPAMRESAHYQKTQQEAEDCVRLMMESRRAYNNTTKVYNEAITKFPICSVAKRMNYFKRELLAEEVEAVPQKESAAGETFSW